MSLKDQFLKAGLVDKKKAKQLEAEKKRQEFDEKKGKKKSSLIEKDRDENAWLKEHKKIHRLKVSPEIARDLAFGKMGICRLFGEEEFFIVPRKAAETVAALSPDKVLVLYPPMRELPDDFMF
jgi:uncharacterized protein YaiL (DUF2058 family)